MLSIRHVESGSPLVKAQRGQIPRRTESIGVLKKLRRLPDHQQTVVNQVIFWVVGYDHPRSDDVHYVGHIVFVVVFEAAGEVYRNMEVKREDVVSFTQVIRVYVAVVF